MSPSDAAPRGQAFDAVGSATDLQSQVKHWGKGLQ